MSASEVSALDKEARLARCHAQLEPSITYLLCAIDKEEGLQTERVAVVAWRSRNVASGPAVQ